MNILDGAASATDSLRNLRAQRVIYNLSRRKKRWVMMAVDCVAVVFAFWAAIALRMSDFWPEQILRAALPMLPLLCVLGPVVFSRFGLYRTLLRAIERRAAFAGLKGAAVLALVPAVASFLLTEIQVPRSVPIIFALVLFVLVMGARLLAQSYYHWLTSRFYQMQPVLIYGAGGAGIQLLGTLDAAPEYDAVAFIDDDRALHKNEIAGRKIYGPEKLPVLIAQFGVERVLLAIPSLPIARRREILLGLSELGVRVQTVPSTPEIVSGHVPIDTLREVSLEDVLGRDSVDPHLDLLADAVRGKSVMVTGAGGSIGGELCRQIAALAPRQLILFEQSEFALYQIDQELEEILELADAPPPVFAVLGSVCDADRVARTIERFGVDTIYHAAAYKHVPLVEQNVLEGLRNNVVGTDVVAREAQRLGVSRVILVSTDKAVRPTSVMGASKRWAELILQGAQASATGTVFSIVRFGNVLGSSGSVIPRFEKQIRQGGPVTVTHPEMVRYFMTIPEAAQLVIQAASLAEGGDVFVLDMGEPVRIAELARHMIALHGLQLKNVDNPDGEIEIVFTGIRPGEKLYEELLIGNDPAPTRHPKIMRAREDFLEVPVLARLMRNLADALEKGDADRGVALVREAVKDYAAGAAPPDVLAPEPVAPGTTPGKRARKRISAPLPS